MSMVKRASARCLVFLFCFLLQDITTTTTASSVTGLSILYQTSSWLGPSGAGILFAFTAGQVDHRRLVFLFFFSLPISYCQQEETQQCTNQPLGKRSEAETFAVFVFPYIPSFVLFSCGKAA